MDIKKGSDWLNIAAIAVALNIGPAIAGNLSEAGSNNSDLALDHNERTHLEFMCEEEKLARDVYITLGATHPDSIIFGSIDDSEEQHKCAVADMLAKYNVPNPSTNDNVGVFTGESYGWYFTEKYNALVEQGSTTDLDALYVGAFIEELDMLDINQCPKVIVETDNEINSVTDCGKVYTEKADINRLYEHLLSGSENHLRAYVKNIEAQIGLGNYKAQVLSQEEVDAILGR